jgi:hypothetical protein
MIGAIRRRRRIVSLSVTIHDPAIKRHVLDHSAHPSCPRSLAEQLSFLGRDGRKLCWIFDVKDGLFLGGEEGVIRVAFLHLRAFLVDGEMDHVLDIGKDTETIFKANFEVEGCCS